MLQGQLTRTYETVRIDINYDGRACGIPIILLKVFISNINKTTERLVNVKQGFINNLKHSLCCIYHICSYMDQIVNI